MTFTGGPLNELNGKMGISAPKNSVAVMKLIKIHRPKGKEELVSLIKSHYRNDCKCGVKSQGTIEDFGKNLYNAQIEYWGTHRYSLKECIQWEYDLFIVQSLKGEIIEKSAFQELKNLLPDYEVCEAKGYVDEELRIDLIVKKESKVIIGIQVKPSSFNHIRQEVINFNKIANEKWGHPVQYLYYDGNEKFINLNEIAKAIKNR